MNLAAQPPGLSDQRLFRGRPGGALLAQGSAFFVHAAVVSQIAADGHLAVAGPWRAVRRGAGREARFGAHHQVFAQVLHHRGEVGHARGELVEVGRDAGVGVGDGVAAHGSGSRCGWRGDGASCRAGNVVSQRLGQRGGQALQLASQSAHGVGHGGAGLVAPALVDAGRLAGGGVCGVPAVRRLLAGLSTEAGGALVVARTEDVAAAVAHNHSTGENESRIRHEIVDMTRPLEFPNIDDLVARYASGVSLKQLAEEVGCSRAPLSRALSKRGVVLRGMSEAERLRWVSIKATPGGVERQLGKAWAVADARNSAMERKALSLYRSGLTSQRRIAERLGVCKATVGTALRRRGISGDRRKERRAVGCEGGFNRQNQTAAEIAFADLLLQRSLDFVHQAAIGTRNVDFAFHAERVAIEIVRRHWSDAKSLARQRLEQLCGAGWRLFVIYDPTQAGIDLPRCADQIVSLLELLRRNPATPGQYRMVCREGELVPESRVKLHHLAPIKGS